MNRAANKFTIPISAIASFVIGGVSLCLFLIQGFRLLVHPAVDLSGLSDTNLRAGQYVQGEITEVYKIQAPNGHWLGNDGEFMKLRSYSSYTVRIAEGRYIRVWLYDKDAIAAMEQLVQGSEGKIVFAGEVKRRNSPLNVAWYSKNPEFDKKLFVENYEIWQQSPYAGRDLLLVGLYGMILAGVIYYWSGGIHRAKPEPESIWPGSRQEEQMPCYAADLESEMIHIRRRLETYRKKEKEYRIEGIVGIVLVLVGGYIDFGLHALGLINWVGLAFLIYGIKQIWTWFLHSKNRIARKIAGIFSLTTLQDKRERDEQFLRKLEQAEEER